MSRRPGTAAQTRGPGRAAGGASSVRSPVAADFIHLALGTVSSVPIALLDLSNKLIAISFNLIQLIIG
jgi:hypothetical protein